MDAEMLAKLVFCFENDPERSDGIISGAQDAIGICIPGLCRHHYDARFWPDKIEQCKDEKILCWLESHLCLVPMFPRKNSCSVVENKDITETKVKALAKAADDCWEAIMRTDLKAFSAAYRASFEAQISMFPAMIQPGVQDYINHYSAMDGVLAWKMTGTAFVDISNAGICRFADIRKKAYHREFLDYAGLDETQMATIVGSGEPIGMISSR